MTNLDSTLKSRDITLPTKVHLVKAMVFPVVMYGCEIWSIKNVECWRIDAFELWCWKRLLRVPWTTRRSKQSILKEIILNIHWKDWCWSSSILTTWCKEMTHWKRPWCWERLWAGGEGGDRGWDGWMASHIQWTWVWARWETVKHSRLPCHSPSPGACSKSCPLSQWYHPIIPRAVIHFSSCPQSFPASQSFF